MLQGTTTSITHDACLRIPSCLLPLITTSSKKTEIFSKKNCEEMESKIEYSGEHAKGDYGGFSNRSNHSFEIGGKRWPTVEHYFQGQKFVGTDSEEAVRNAKNADAAHRMGRDRSRPLRSDWETVKEQVAEEAIRAKFQQNAELRDLLLSTGEAVLVQKTRNDNYWGDSDGNGKNVMGNILMKIRAELKEK